MVCICGHNKIEHAYGRDYGSHGYNCEHRNEKGNHNCGCEYYRKKTKVIKNGDGNES